MGQGWRNLPRNRTDTYDGQTLQFLNMLNSTWNNAFAPGGLRHGDTVWMNMHYTNPHAIDGMFCKSRGVFNQFEVWNGFNSGKGAVTTEANSTLALENFLIGDTCRETAANFAQHVNETVSLNWQQQTCRGKPDMIIHDLMMFLFG